MSLKILGLFGIGGLFGQDGLERVGGLFAGQSNRNAEAVILQRGNFSSQQQVVHAGADERFKASEPGLDGEVGILVPPELSAPSYDVTVQAELLDPAKKVLAIAYAPVRRMIVNMPFVVKLDGSDRIEAALDAKKGTVVKIAGNGKSALISW